MGQRFQLKIPLDILQGGSGKKQDEQLAHKFDWFIGWNIYVYLLKIAGQEGGGGIKKIFFCRGQMSSSIW